MRAWRKWVARVVLLSLGLWLTVGIPGCGFGPHTLHQTRLPYNEAVKVTSEEQLLLNIVRLRYSDNPSSLAVTSIAAQFELAKKLQLIPFFTSGGDVQPRGFTSLLPGAELTGADRPTLSLTPQDESEFTRRLFNPLSLEGVVYLAKTTWPISTVFRLYLENLNWVSNAQTISGPTPKEPPQYADFLRGMQALQRLQDNNQIAIVLEEREERVGSPLDGSKVVGRDLVEAVKANHEWKREVSTGKSGEKEDWSLIRKKDTPFLYVHPAAQASEDWLEVCRTFKIKPGLKQYELEVTKLSPFPSEYPPEGVKVIDLETRSLLQVLYFIAHGVEVPPCHVAEGLARVTVEADGTVFDYQQVLGGLFHVCWAKGKKRPANAAVAVCYKGHWFYIDEADHDTRATFALMVQLSRLELGTKAGGAPVLTLPLGGR